MANRCACAANDRIAKALAQFGEAHADLAVAGFMSANVVHLQREQRGPTAPRDCINEWLLAGISPTLARVLEAHAGNEEVEFWGTFALVALTDFARLSRSGETLLVTEWQPLLPRLVNISQRLTHPQHVVFALNSLCNITSDRHTYLMTQAADAGAFSMVVQHMNEFVSVGPGRLKEPYLVAYSGMRAVMNLTYRDDKDHLTAIEGTMRKERALEANALEAVVQGMGAHLQVVESELERRVVSRHPTFT